LRGHEIRDVSVVAKLFVNFVAQGDNGIWDVQISDRVTAPVIRETSSAGTGICHVRTLARPDCASQ
jgi:hypothetical protein